MPLTAAAPTLSTDAPSLSAFGLLPQDLLVFPPGSLSRVAGVDSEGTLWVELLLDEGDENDENDNGDGLSSLPSALSPTALRPGDAVARAPEHARIDFEAGRARKDQKAQQKRARAAAAAAALKAERRRKSRGAAF